MRIPSYGPGISAGGIAGADKECRIGEAAVPTEKPISLEDVSFAPKQVSNVIDHPERNNKYNNPSVFE